MKIIYRDEKKERIDKYLVSLQITELYSRSYINKLIEDRYILVNNKPVKKNFKLSSSDEITIDFPEKEEVTIQPQNISIEVIWEDEDIIIVNKPAGLIVHPGAGVKDGTLVNALM